MMVRFFKELYNNNKLLCKIILLGFLLRIFFTVFIAPHYFNRPSIFYDHDTNAWITALYNLWHHGEFTIMPGNEYAAYCRMPGYTFFMAPSLMLVVFLNKLQGIDVYNNPELWNTVLKLTANIQIILDSLAIYLFYAIANKATKSHKIAIVAALLYASYPFLIVWNPVCYSEIPSVFFALLTLYLVLHKEHYYALAIAGFCLGFAVLNRPQYAILAPLMILVFYHKYTPIYKKLILKSGVFFLFFAITYGSWPLRNYIRFNKIIITQDLKGFENWNIDVLAFMQYIYSVKSDWNPQFSDIIHNRPVVFPKESYISIEDSLKLERAVSLSKTCGRGFSEWKGYWKETIPIWDTANDCSAEVASLFNELRQNQIKQHPYNFYIHVPLQNLKKALFKSALQDSSNWTRKLGGLLFYYRSLLIFLGLVGLLVMSGQKENWSWVSLIGGFFVILYIYLCFGTSPQCRNIEIRYFLQPDILLLIPAAYVIVKSKLFNRWLPQ